MYIYYGKSDATYAGDGEATFLFFDDFSEAELDPDKWWIYGHTEISDGILTFYGGSGYHGSGNRIQSKTSFSPGVAWRFKAKYDLTTYYTIRSGLTDGSNPSKRFGSDPDNTFLDVTPENGNERLINRVDASGVSANLQSISENVWRTWELRWLSNKTVLVCFETGNSVSLTDKVPSVDLYPGFDAEGTGQSKWYIDIVFLRKYVDPEPSHGTWYAEEEQKVTLSGKVQLPDGTAVANATIIVIDEETNEILATTTSASDGTWSVEISPGKTVTVVAIPQESDYGGDAKPHIQAS
ncbi:MAG: hypothetical protein DRP01_01995 [Archaeoglobales archaeon]|nr:MAG: hypothetical protein DRP01_01995 [Archaeoglobales archaeon]